MLADHSLIASSFGRKKSYPTQSMRVKKSYPAVPNPIRGLTQVTRAVSVCVTARRKLVFSGGRGCCVPAGCMSRGWTAEVLAVVEEQLK